MRWIVAAAVLLTLSFPRVASADTCTFQGADWHAAGDWRGCSGQVPGADDDVVIPSPLMANVSTANAAANSVQLASGARISVSDARTLDIDGGAASAMDGDVEVLDAGSILRLANTNWRQSSWAIGGEKGGSTLNDPGGTVENAGDLTLNGVGFTASNAGGGRIVNLASGYLYSNDATASLAVPFQNDGRVSVASGLTLGAGSGGTSGGDYVISGGPLRLGGAHTISLTGGVTGPGTLQLLPGTLTLAADAAYSPVETVFAGGWLSLAGSGSTLVVSSTGAGGGRSGTGTLAVGDAGSNLTGVAFIGGGETTFSSGGNIDATGDVEVRDAGTVVRLRGFTFWRAGTWSIGGQRDPTTSDDDGGSVENAGILDVAGDVTAKDLGSGAIVNLAGAELNRITSAGTAMLGPPLSNAGTLNISTGTLAAAVTQTAGATNVASTLAGSVTAAGGYVTGAGTITGDLENDGATVSPGNLPGETSGDGYSPGTLSVGSFSQGPSGTLIVELREATQGSGFDVVQVGGPASLGGTVVANNSFDPQLGGTFTFLTATTMLGEFDSLTGGGLPSGRSFALDYPASDDAVRLIVVPGPVPPAPPANTNPPLIAGMLAIGSTLTCEVGSWTGVTSFTFQWLLDGTPIAGATDQRFVPGDVVADRKLTCRVTASGPGGSTVVTSAAVVVPPGDRPNSPEPPPTPTTTPVSTSPAWIPTLPTGPSHVPTPTAAERGLAKASPSRVAKVFGLPSARSCIPRRTFVIRLQRPPRVRIASVQMRVNGEQVRARRVNGRFAARINLRRTPEGRFTVRIRIRTVSRRTLEGRRRYRTCASRRRV